MEISEKVRELDEQVAQAVRRAVEDLREEMRQRLDEATVELQRRLGEVAPDLPASFVTEEHLRQITEEAAAPAAEALDRARDEARTEGRAEGLSAGRIEGQLQARVEAQESLRDAIAEIDRAGSQAEVLEALLGAAVRYAGRAAVLLAREGRLAGWEARGFEADPETVRSLSLASDADPWSALIAGGPAVRVAGARCAPLVSQLDSPLPREGCAVPLVLRDRAAAVLYADRTEEGRLDISVLQVLTYAAALALETLPFRQRESTATLDPVAGAAAAAEMAEQAVEQPAEAAAEPVPEAEAGWGEEADELEDGLLEEELEVELEEPETYGAPPEGEALLEAVEEEDVTPTARPPFEESAFEEVPPLEEEPEEGFEAEPAELTAPAEPLGTIAWRTEPEEAVEEAVAEEPPGEPIEATHQGELPELEGEPEAGDIQPATAPVAAGGQVAPPDDVEGPGWAFSATRGAVPKDTEASHEEARRLARLLVSEIQLYNQDQVDEGRRNRDIYERLKDDIDRSRQLYEDRV
ncbi:MAG TPA: hypothetical protein VMR44_07750, partial [Thermoanaerobaculia bacterium]|nr:hypothetical protein [Thermoanaerobaculia bacterium]